MINLIIAYDQIFSDKLTLTTNTFSRASSVFERGEIQILLHGMWWFKVPVTGNCIFELALN